MPNYFKCTVISGTKYWGHTEHGRNRKLFLALGEEESKSIQLRSALLAILYNTTSTATENFIIYYILFHNFLYLCNVIYVCYLLTIRCLRLETILMSLIISFSKYYSILQIINS